MSSSPLIDELLFRSESSDLDFKSQQYRLRGASDADKGKLLKDILALANAWRDGPGRILIGFREDRPNPAVVVGIADHLDDADLQQFVRSKVRPTLDFHYEEVLYQGKTVGILTIPKQTRPFYATSPLGPVQANVVYVRRGSSNVEAEPPEITKMHLADMGKGQANVAIRLVLDDGSHLPEMASARFVSFDDERQLPDYALPRPDGPAGFGSLGLAGRANPRYWRELAKYLRHHLAALLVRLEVENRSGFALNDCKLEVTAKPLDGQSVRLMEEDDLPRQPRSEYDALSHVQSLPEILARNTRGFAVEGFAGAEQCVARFQSVLPGEVARANGVLALLPSAPGRLQLVCRLLASELSSPITLEHALTVSGPVEQFGYEDLRNPRSRLFTQASQP